MVALHDPKGKFVYVFGTMPREKHRCFRPRKRPFVVAEHMTGDTTHKQVLEAYKEATRDSLKGLGGTFDPGVRRSRARVFQCRAAPQVKRLRSRVTFEEVPVTFSPISKQPWNG